MVLEPDGMYCLVFIARCCEGTRKKAPAGSGGAIAAMCCCTLGDMPSRCGLSQEVSLRCNMDDNMRSVRQINRIHRGSRC